MVNKLILQSNQIRKLDPKLRMFVSCDESVNEKRAEFKGSLATRSQVKSDVSRLENTAVIPKFSKIFEKKSLKRSSDNILSNVFIELVKSKTFKNIEGQLKRKGNLVAAQLPLTKLEALTLRDDILNIESTSYLYSPQPKTNDKSSASPNMKWEVLTNETEINGSPDVIIGIIDVGGFDFAHPDFLNENGETRFLKIWDQGGDTRNPPQEPYQYGAEFDQADLNEAIVQSPIIGVPATHIERQSQMSEGSHGTHVASIAAGNSGVCPNALIAGVLISLNDEDQDRRKSFYDSMSVAHAVDYLVRLAEQENLPLSINISLGTNGHAHDGSDIVSRWVDADLMVPGRAVCVAAGNAGQEAPITPDDYGFIMGRIHTSGQIKATGLAEDIHWRVVGNGIADLSENELEIWYEPQDLFSVSVKPPGMDWIGPIPSNHFIQNKQLIDGSFLNVYNEQYHPSNGLNYIGIYLSPNFNDQQVIPIRAGVWQIRLHGDEVRNGKYHGWIERDDPRKLGPIGAREAWNFPSFFMENSNVDNSSISSLACAKHVIAVANLDMESETVNISSSQGPTRDGRFKPEIGAPGTNIIAAKGFCPLHNDHWISMTGTSMASPYVCGVVAQMLRRNPLLTASQISGILKRTSSPLPGNDYAWKNDAGYGVVNPVACINEAQNINNKQEVSL